jgi:hypothetical protein
VGGGGASTGQNNTFKIMYHIKTAKFNKMLEQSKTSMKPVGTITKKRENNYQNLENHKNQQKTTTNIPIHTNP